MRLSLNKLKLKNLYCEKDVEDECQCTVNAFFFSVVKKQTNSRIFHLFCICNLHAFFLFANQVRSSFLSFKVGLQESVKQKHTTHAYCTKVL